MVALTLAVLGNAALLPLASAPVQAQEMGPLSQVDITEGIAERSAQHVANSGAVPQQQVPLQGFASQSNSGMQQQNYSQSQQGYSNGGYNEPQNGSNAMGMNQQNLSCSASQNLSNNSCQGNENLGNNQCGQNFNNNQNNQNSQGNQNYNNCQNNMQQNGNCYNNGGNGNGNSGSGSGSGFGINKQMVGVLGAALLVNYAVNGGVANFMGEMRSRGYNNHFRGFGPSIGR